ncbi:diguanylate cyclase [Paraliobacillus zengyii]|uniref:diguanylate cyclase n=1 Tax=Paraliobacillus zengyii TaxID=2213194 RepID=UPI001E57ED50|nr:diguanylate cyclase [Paraliobacillus zengyii]
MIPFKNYTHLYIASIGLVGIIAYLMVGDIGFQSLYDWIMGYALIGVTLLLFKYVIVLPPKGNSLSMDTAIFLACLFLFGIEFSLNVLLFSSLIYSFYEKRINWSKHLFNFSAYTIMLISTYYVFLFFNGTIGSINFINLFAYLASFLIYFFVNSLIISTYFWISDKKSLIGVLDGMLKGTLESYVVTLVLSLVLGYLMDSSGVFGLALFAVISILLSIVFKQYFSLYESVKTKANMDHLTGLYNHGYFKEILNEKFEEMKQITINKPLSMAMLDIDDFKIFNDSNGHMKGDHVLTLFGEILIEKCKEKDYVVARYGGEEFVILMPETTENQANDFIECIRKELNNTYVDGVERLPYGCLSFSAGIIEWNIEMYNPTEFLTHADQAMYYAKEQGKNNTHIYGHEFEPLEITASLEELEQQLKLLLAKDIYTYRHSKRVFKFAVEFGKYLLLNEQDKKILSLGALVHDIGKLEVPREIINKTGKLTAEEWNAVKKHVTWGREIIQVDKKNASLVPLVELHHERFDGKGYPYGKKAEEIPKLARILCVIDSFDAMTTERPYQKTKSYNDALDELRDCAGTQFDPFYAKAFIDYFNKEYMQVEEDITTI